MNRRSFLSFLSAAPVALPMAAKAVTAKSEAFWAEAVAGEFVELSAEPFAGVGGEVHRFTPHFHSTIEAVQESERLQTMFRVNAWRGDADVEAQMLAHDLFDFDFDALRDTNTPVSPDDQEKRKPEYLS